MSSNSTGDGNSAYGFQALAENTSGSYNIAQGYEAGSLTTGSYNIDIGNAGVAGESGVIRIGTSSNQSAAYIAGIYGHSGGTYPVYIDSSGRLWTQASSERYKTDIAPMGESTAKLRQLRPVTFRYKGEPDGSVRYGLIAEEVATVYPELVVRDAEGRIDGVRYEALAPMLLNEMRQQDEQMTRKIAAQAAEIRELKRQVTDLGDLKQQLRAALEALKAQDQLVAQR